MSNTIYNSIKELAGALSPKLKNIRRDLHTYAEPGWCEIRTSSIIAQYLTELGYQVIIGNDVCLDESRMGIPTPETFEIEYQRALDQGAVPAFAEKMKNGFTGVIGILDCGEGPVIAMRFDIDALGVFEERSDIHRPYNENFASVNDGVMHACGHDGHAAIGIGVAEVLMACRSQLSGKIKLIFQPAEEGVRGAKSIAAHGHLDDVDYIIANHITDSGNGSYDIGLTTGATLATTKLDIHYRGKAAHAGAVPEKGENAMLAAATAVLNLHAIPRSSAGDTRINAGVLQAGSGRNVICDRAKLEIEIRGATTSVNQFMEDYAKRIAYAAAEMHGCSCNIKMEGSAESMWSDVDMIDRCSAVCNEKLGLKVSPPGTKAGASEDFSYMLNCVRSHGGQGLFFTTMSKCSGPFHSKCFDFQEEALSHGVMVFCGLACDIMGITF